MSMSLRYFYDLYQVCWSCCHAGPGRGQGWVTDGAGLVSAAPSAAPVRTEHTQSRHRQAARAWPGHTRGEQVRILHMLPPSHLRNEVPFLDIFAIFPQNNNTRCLLIEFSHIKLWLCPSIWRDLYYFDCEEEASQFLLVSVLFSFKKLPFQVVFS